MEPLSHLRQLASLAPAPCVTLYLDLRRIDPEGRTRTRVFVEQRIERALRASDDPRLRADLERVSEEVHDRLLRLEGNPRSIAMFACSTADLFRTVELNVPVQDELVIANAPALRQLARISDEYERTLLVLVSAEDARIYEIVLGRVDSTEALRSERRVNTHRSDRLSPGWSQMHYQRHVREQIDRHLREVADRTTHLVDEHAPHVIVVGGAHPTVDRFVHQLPQRIRMRVVDVVALPPDAPIGDAVHAALSAMSDEERRSELDGVRETIDLALAGGPAALGIDEVVSAAREKKLMTLYIAYGFRAQGGRCRDCGALSRETRSACAFCDGLCEVVDLGEALVKEAIAQDGSVDFVPSSASLQKFEGIAAQLRW